MVFVDHIQWHKSHLVLLDQRKLPSSKEYFQCKTLDDVGFAIKNMVVRGAPAIGIVAAYGVALDSLNQNFTACSQLKERVQYACEVLSKTRPTAVNLFWALERMKDKALHSKFNTVNDLKSFLEKEALHIHEEDIEMNKKIGNFGSTLLESNSCVLTHCNAGSLATGGYGTALGIVRSAWNQKKIKHVIASETRPVLQGARLTSWELSQEGIPVTVATDNMIASLMQKGTINAVIVGADRIARNGDVANKIGTYSLAVLAHHHKIPFYVAAPSSTLDRKLSDGSKIPIEERDSSEVVQINGKRLVPEGVGVFNPSFDVTPSQLISAIILETGVFKFPYSF